MNARQRRKAIRAGTHYRCDNCDAFEPMPYIALQGCRRCWSAAARRRERYLQELANAAAAQLKAEHPELADEPVHVSSR